MAVSFKEFRDRYPDASIVSELLAIQNQDYIVRVTIKTQQLGVSTGFSADPNLEVAEDRARRRAFEALGIDGIDKLIPNNTEVPPLEAHLHQAVEELIVSNSPNSHRDVVESELPSASPSVRTHQEVVPRAQAAATATHSPPAVRRTSPPESAFLNTPKPAIAPASVSMSQADDSESLQPVNTAPASSLEAVLPPPINLSDVIAQTDIELRRLGWSVEAGRQYLEETYNKRSRHELSEEELIQFLCYLESLPEPQPAPS